jgi:hypothetical protein
MATVNESDTWIGSSDGDTMCLHVSPGQRVTISAGLMEGSQAVVVEQRTHGRVLVRLEHGVFVEIHQYCLEQLKKR